MAPKDEKKLTTMAGLLIDRWVLGAPDDGLPPVAFLLRLG